MGAGRFKGRNLSPPPKGQPNGRSIAVGYGYCEPIVKEQVPVYGKQANTGQASVISFGLSQ
jgi:hypothetical protein